MTDSCCCALKPPWMETLSSIICFEGLSEKGTDLDKIPDLMCAL